MKLTDERGGVENGAHERYNTITALVLRRCHTVTELRFCTVLFVVVMLQETKGTIDKWRNIEIAKINTVKINYIMNCSKNTTLLSLSISLTFARDTKDGPEFQPPDKTIDQTGMI